MDLVAGLIDVFADEPLSGNPLAVVEDADDLTVDQMRRIAGEFNQAETTFIKRSTRADRRLRSFTASGRRFNRKSARRSCRLSSGLSTDGCMGRCVRRLSSCCRRSAIYRLWPEHLGCRTRIS